MFVTDVKCSQATWQTIPNSWTDSSKAFVSKAVVHTRHRTHVVKGRQKSRPNLHYQSDQRCLWSFPQRTGEVTRPPDWRWEGELSTLVLPEWQKARSSSLGCMHTYAGDQTWSAGVPTVSRPAGRPQRLTAHTPAHEHSIIISTPDILDTHKPFRHSAPWRLVCDVTAAAVYAIAFVMLLLLLWRYFLFLFYFFNFYFLLLISLSIFFLFVLLLF